MSKSSKFQRLKNVFRQRRSTLLNENLKQQIIARIANLGLPPQDIFAQIMRGNAEVYGTQAFYEISAMLPELPSFLKSGRRNVSVDNDADRLFLLVKRVKGLRLKADVMRFAVQVGTTFSEFFKKVAGVNNALEEVMDSWLPHISNIFHGIAENRGVPMTGPFFQDFMNLRTDVQDQVMAAVAEAIRRKTPYMAQLVDELPNAVFGLQVENPVDFIVEGNGLETELHKLQEKFDNVSSIPSIPGESFNLSIQDFISEYESYFVDVPQLVEGMTMNYVKIGKMFNFSPQNYNVDTFFNGVILFIDKFKAAATRAGLFEDVPLNRALHRKAWPPQ